MSHFVKKVPTTEEEQAALKVANAKKMKIFVGLSTRINEKIASKNFDQEFMRDTALVLTKSPNIQSLWNFRRDALLMRMKQTEGESEEETKEKVKNICEEELTLSAEAIMKDAKSYCAWFHRFWAFQHHPTPDVDNEIDNCDKALCADTRNFHAWDHLRSVAKFANLGAQKAVAFSRTRLQQDITNYSAYHYRATELPNVQPDPEGAMEISVAALDAEIELVKGSAFTEPKDQSPWVYSMWLLEQASTNDQSDEIVLLSATTKAIAFSRPISVKDIRKYVEIADSALIYPASAAISGNPQYQMTSNWSLSAVSELKIRSTGEVISEEGRYVNKEAIRKCFSDASIKSSAAESSFRQFMEECDQLVELEPDCLWPLYFKTLCLLKIGKSLESYDTIMANYKRMAELDPMRKNVYLSKASGLSIRKALLVDKHVVDTEKTQLEAILDGRDDLRLRNYGITDISILKPLGGLVADIDLSYCGITELKQFQAISALDRLNLDDNPIASLSAGLKLPNLTFLSLARTKIESVDDVKVVQDFKKLERLLVCETKLVEAAQELQSFIAGLRSEIESPIRVFVHYL